MAMKRNNGLQEGIKMILKRMSRLKSMKIILTVLLAGIIVLLPCVRLSKADDISTRMENLFQDMGFRSATTAPGVYESQSRGFFVGGSLKARSQSVTIQPFSLKMPDIKAGCGGIDIFGGSFSFINADQLINFLKAVGQNALGYAFSLGLEAVCPTCNSVLKTLRGWMNDLNKFSLDSCLAAKALVNGAGDAAGFWQLNDCEGQNAKDGDYIQGWLTCAAGSENSIRQQLRNTASNNEAARKNDIRKTNSGGISTSQAFEDQNTLSEEEVQMAVSLLGTYYLIDFPNNSSDPGNEGTMTQCGFENPSVTLENLVEGGQLQLLTCTSGTFLGKDCKGPMVKTPTTVEGYKEKAMKTMISIKDKLKNGQELSDEEKDFVRGVKVPPVLKMLMTTTTYSEDLTNGVIDLTSEIAGVSYAWYLIDEYMSMFKKGMFRITACSVAASPDKIMAQVRDVERSRFELYQKYAKEIEVQSAMVNLLAGIETKIINTASDRIKRGLNY